MQIVIDIDDNLYTRLFDNGGDDYDYAVDMATAIRKGTPLPKGHGDLIDRKELIENGISKGFCDWYDEIKMADTIIEADEGSDDE